MARIDNRNKQNTKLLQAELSDGRASLYLEYYLGRSETPVLDEDGQQVFYTDGAMNESFKSGKCKFETYISTMTIKFHDIFFSTGYK